MPPIAGELSPCMNGYHLCREGDLMEWLGPVIYEAEYRGEFLRSQDKLVCREARLLRRLDTWNETTMRLFAADCAERVPPIWEQQYLENSRPRDVIIAARAFARYVAANAANAVARAAAYAAADSAAERAWQTTRLLQYLRGEVS
jgi:hypothetical protein